jgi:hypothetical protein
LFSGIFPNIVVLQLSLHTHFLPATVETSEGACCPSSSLTDKNEEKVQVIHGDMWHVINDV